MAGFFTKLHGTLTLKDAANTPDTFSDVSLETGDMSIDGLEPSNKSTFEVYARGAFVGLEHGDDAKVTFSCTYHQKRETLHHASADRLVDFLTKQGGFASDTSANPGDAGVWMCNALFTMTDGTTTATITLSKCRITFSISDGEPNAIKLSGTCYGGVVYA